MRCFMCKAELENGKATFMADLGSCIVIIKDVPAFICPQCGEVSYSNEVAKTLQRIVLKLKGTVTDIAVTTYQEVA